MQSVNARRYSAADTFAVARLNTSAQKIDQEGPFVAGEIFSSHNESDPAGQHQKGNHHAGPHVLRKRTARKHAGHPDRYRGASGQHTAKPDDKERAYDGMQPVSYTHLTLPTIYSV